MIWIILLSIVTYTRSLFNGFISDDITVNASLRDKGYPLTFDFNNPISFIQHIPYRLWKNNPLPHHILSLVIYVGLCLSIYHVGSKFIPQNIMLLATLFFIVHPCNTQIGGWISGKWYAVGLIVGLWALYFNNLLGYLIIPFITCTMSPLVFFMDLPIITKILSCGLFVLLLYRSLKGKVDLAKRDESYKKDNIKLFWRKLIIVVKSFTYYFCLAFFPLKMGWFHQIGEPITEDLKSINFHFVLCLLLIATLGLFIGTKAFIGLLIFCVFIAPFTNLITFALFTSERYMSPALIGWSIFLSYNLINYPIISAVIISVYFMRTQLELLAYRDDFSLALSSLFNFDRSGFAWANIANIFLYANKPTPAYAILKEAEKYVPEFPTINYQLYIINRASDLLNNQNDALKYLEKACRYGGHKNWYDELDKFKKELKLHRIKKFKESYAIKYPEIRGNRCSPQLATSRVETGFQQCLC